MRLWMVVALIIPLTVCASSAQQVAPGGGPSGSQGGSAPGGTSGDTASKLKVMEGIVKSVDEAKHQVTLQDGTQFTVPVTAEISWAELKPGESVLVSYLDTAPQKALYKIQVE